MKVIICGSRLITLEPEVIADIVDLSGYKITTLICGMAKGVDMSAYNWAKYYAQIPIIEKPYKSQYEELGGHMRNQEMVDIADAWIGICQGRLTVGTQDCYHRAYKANLPRFLYNMDGLI